MELKSKVVVLFFIVIAVSAQAKKAYGDIYAADPICYANPALNTIAVSKHLDGGEGSIVVIDDDLVVDSKGNGNITHVQIKRSNGTTLATYNGCGDSETCSYGMSGFDHNTYHVIVTTTSTTFEGNITW